MFEGIIGIGRFGFHFDCMLCESYQVQSETHSDREFVVHTNDLKSAVLDHPQCMGLDMNAVADRLESLNIIDKAVRHEHIRDLQNTYSGKL